MNIEGLNIPDFWCAKLNDLKKSCPSAVIAGGAIRDLYYGVEVKDIDFFTSGNLPIWPFARQSNKDYEGMKYVHCVAEYNDEFNLNVIVTETVTPMELISSFDLGFCQIAFDGEKLIKSIAFEWDSKYGVITLRHIDRYSRSIKRYSRINQRYGRDLIIPQLEQINAKTK